MLCIILTKSKLIAGVRKSDQSELLSIAGKPHIDFGAKSMLQVLEANLDKIDKAYRDQTKTGNDKQPVPVAVAFSVGNMQKDGSLYDQQQIRSFFAKDKTRRFDLIYAEHLPMSYLRGVNGDPRLADQGVVVLEALDDHLNLCYCNLPKSKINGKSLGTDNFRYISFQEIGTASGVEQLLGDVVGQFAKAGFTVDDRDRAALKGQLVRKMADPVKDYTYSLTKSAGAVRIRAEVDVSARRHEEVVASNIPSLKPRLNRDKLDALGVGKVVLLGSYLENSYVKDFLAKELSLKDKVLAPSIGDSEFQFKAIVKGLNHTAVEVAAAKAAEEKRRREEEARRKALEAERQRNAEREGLLARIRTTCVDSLKKADYEKMFIEEGTKLDMPSEVIKWNIEEALRSASLQMPAPSVGSSLTPTVMPRVSDNFNGSGLPRLHDQYKIEGVLLDPEFATKKATPRDGGSQKVVRLLEAPNLVNQDMVARFEHLYQKELAYYQELSEIQDAPEGKFYSRDFIPRHTLKEHIKKMGMDKKPSFDKLSSKEIKFILEILDEVKDLPVPHANLNEYNILVLQEGLFKKNTEIRFVGFTSEDCTVKEMEERAHEMFNNLLRPKVYADFRKNLNI